MSPGVAALRYVTLILPTRERRGRRRQAQRDLHLVMPPATLSTRLAGFRRLGYSGSGALSPRPSNTNGDNNAIE